jgi:putative hydrolase of the HAD superfamily
MRIQAVTFDVGGTLIEPWPSVGHVYAEAAAQHGLKNLSAESLNTRFKVAWKSRNPFGHSREAWMELVDEVFGGLTTEPPSTTFFPKLYDRFADPEAWRIYDDVVPTLDELAARKIRLGVISNWDERLRGLLRDLNLERYFESIIVSCEIGFPKPSPVIFRHAAAKMGVPPQAVLHVGDSFEMDVEGARAAGFHAVQIHRTAEPPTVNEVRSLRQLKERILPVN